MAITGWYYLHENNDLIYKPSPDAIADIRDSDFAKCVWPIDPENRELAWDILVESLALGAKESRIITLAAKWNCTDADADIYADRVGVKITTDGNQFCATRLDFLDLQQSPAGFGDSKLEAMAALAKELGLKPGKMWRDTFKELLKS